MKAGWADRAGRIQPGLAGVGGPGREHSTPPTSHVVYFSKNQGSRHLRCRVMYILWLQSTQVELG